MASLWDCPTERLCSLLTQRCYPSHRCRLPLAGPMFSRHLKKSLLSIGQFCDSNFTYVFRKFQVKLSNDDTTITGQRDPINGLYYIDLPEPPPVAPPALHPFACSTYEMKTKAELVQYLHQWSFSPVVHTWTKAIDVENFATWPGLTSELVRKHLLNSIATAKVHLKQDRQNICSTIFWLVSAYWPVLIMLQDKTKIHK